MGERMEEVEVVCLACGGDTTRRGYGNVAVIGGDGSVCGVSVVQKNFICPSCKDGVAKFPVPPNSLTAARLRLADAAEAWWMAKGGTVEWSELLRALAALRTKRGAGGPT